MPTLYMSFHLAPRGKEVTLVKCPRHENDGCFLVITQEFKDSMAEYVPAMAESRAKKQH